MLDGQYCASTFIDASYTGELLYRAGASYRLGMKDLLDYNESYAHARQVIECFPVSSQEYFVTNPFVANSGGSVVDGMPSITYRICVTKKENNISFSKTDGYGDFVGSWREMVRGYWDNSQFTSLRRVEVTSIGTINSPFYQIAKLPNDKYDMNSGWSSFMNVVTSEEYFYSYAHRNEFNDKLKDYMQNWFVFLQTDSSVPSEVQDAFDGFGLCADEFIENDGWPEQPYLREGRRLVGEYTITQEDIYANRTKEDSVALSSCHLDSKLTQIWQSDGFVYRDHGPFATTPIYEVPYSSMVPEMKNPSNLLVTVGLSASPVAYGSLRMEPQYMSFGEAAGVAAAVAYRNGVYVSNVDHREVQDVLVERGAVFKAKEICLERIPRQWRDLVGFSSDCDVIPQQ